MSQLRANPVPYGDLPKTSAFLPDDELQIIRNGKFFSINESAILKPDVVIPVSSNLFQWVSVLKEGVTFAYGEDLQNAPHVQAPYFFIIRRQKFYGYSDFFTSITAVNAATNEVHTITYSPNVGWDVWRSSSDLREQAVEPPLTGDEEFLLIQAGKYKKAKAQDVADAADLTTDETLLLLENGKLKKYKLDIPDAATPFDNDVYLTVIQENKYRKIKVKKEQTRQVTLSTNIERQTSQIWDGKLYMPPGSGNTLEIFDLTTEQSRTVVLPRNIAGRTSQIWNNRLYMLNSAGNIEHFNLFTEQMSDIPLPAGSKYVLLVLGSKMYIPYAGAAGVCRILDLISGDSIETVTLTDSGNYSMCFHWQNKIYMPSNSKIEILDVNTKQARSVDRTTSMQSSGCLWKNKIYLFGNLAINNVIEVFDLTTEQSRTVTAANMGRQTSQTWNGKLYMPVSSGVSLEIFDLTTEQSRTVSLSTPISRQTSQIWDGKLYMPANSGNVLEIFDCNSFLDLL